MYICFPNVWIWRPKLLWHFFGSSWNFSFYSFLCPTPVGEKNELQLNSGKPNSRLLCVLKLPVSESKNHMMKEKVLLFSNTWKSFKWKVIFYILFPLIGQMWSLLILCFPKTNIPSTNEHLIPEHHQLKNNTKREFAVGSMEF